MIVQYDGYEVGDRLLEGVMFDVHLEERDGDVVLTEVTDPTDRASKAYLKNIKTGHFRKMIAKNVEDNLIHLRKQAEREGKTLVQLFDEWEAQGEDRASLVVEV
jgi:hypothetical protein